MANEEQSTTIFLRISPELKAEAKKRARLGDLRLAQYIRALIRADVKASKAGA